MTSSSSDDQDPPKDDAPKNINNTTSATTNASSPTIAAVTTSITNTVALHAEKSPLSDSDADTHNTNDATTKQYHPTHSNHKPPPQAFASLPLSSGSILNKGSSNTARRPSSGVGGAVEERGLETVQKGPSVAVPSDAQVIDHEQNEEGLLPPPKELLEYFEMEKVDEHQPPMDVLVKDGSKVDTRNRSSSANPSLHDADEIEAKGKNSSSNELDLSHTKKMKRKSITKSSVLPKNLPKKEDLTLSPSIYDSNYDNEEAKKYSKQPQLQHESTDGLHSDKPFTTILRKKSMDCSSTSSLSSHKEEIRSNIIYKNKNNDLNNGSPTNNDLCMDASNSNSATRSCNQFAISDLSQDSSANNNSGKDVFNFLTAGNVGLPSSVEGSSRPPSVLSSKGSQNNYQSSISNNSSGNGNDSGIAKEDEEETKLREEKRMKDLGLLLDLHQENEQRKKQQQQEEETKTKKNKKTGNRSAVRSAGASGNGSASSSKQQNEKSSTSRDPKASKKQPSMSGASVSSIASVNTATIIQRSSNPTSLFETFEKNWATFCPSTSNVERMCFTGLVTVLLDDVEGSLSSKSSTTSMLSSSSSGPSTTRASNVNNNNKCVSPRRKGRVLFSRANLSMQVVKLFWEKVILPDVGISSEENHMGVIESIAETLFEKLRYLVLVPVLPSSSSQQNSFSSTSETPMTTNKHQHDSSNNTTVRLSHEVYGEYARYILELTGLAQTKVEEWHSKFANVLEKGLVSESLGSTPVEVQKYAAITLPWHILSSFRSSHASPSTSVSKGALVAKFVKTMCNPHFLSWRMVVLGAGLKVDGMTNDGEQQEKSSKKKSMTTVDQVRSNWDILKATQMHLNDVEELLIILSPTLNEVNIPNHNGDSLESTKAIQAIYRSWQLECLEIFKRARKHLTKDKEQSFGKKSKRRSSMSSAVSSRRSSMSTVSFSDVSRSVTSQQTNPTSASSVSVSFSSQISDDKLDFPRNVTSSKKVTGRHSKVIYIRSCETSANGLPSHFQLSRGEYTVDSSKVIPSLEKVSSTNDTYNMKTLPHIRGSSNNSMKNRDARNLSSSAIMKLSDVLQVDLRILFLEITMGKAMYLLSQSMAKAAEDNANCNNTNLSTVLSGPAFTTTKIKYISDAIHIYTGAINIMSFLLSNDLDGIDEDDLSDLRYNHLSKESPQRAMKRMKRERLEAKSLIAKLRLLCAESWYDIGRIIIEGAKESHSIALEMAKISILRLPTDFSFFEEEQYRQDGRKDGDERDLVRNKVLHCYQFALSLLRQQSTPNINEGNVGFSSYPHVHDTSNSEQEHIETHKRTVLASIIHSIGVHYYAQVGNLETAKLCIYEALSRRRLLLRQFQKECNDASSVGGSSAGSRSIVGSTENSNGGGRDSRHYKRNKATRRGSLESSSSYAYPQHDGTKTRNDLLIDIGNSRKKRLNAMELNLSKTLEFAALISHSLRDHQTSVSFFQEAIILRALHAGKDSLDVARLHFNMGVVHDDLGQHGASLGRYGKSLIVRMSQMEHARKGKECPIEKGALIDIDELEASVVLTLRCMGNVYRALKDETNAIGCYVKAIEILKTRLKNQTDSSSYGIYQQSGFDLGFGKGKGGEPTDLPAPGEDINEIQEEKASSKAAPKADLSENDLVRKDIANMYSTIISLANERKQQSESNKSRSRSRSGYISSSSYSSYGSSTSQERSRKSKKSRSSRKKKNNSKIDEHDEDDKILLHGTFNLGMLTMHFGEYQNAVCYFEETLRILWTSLVYDSDETSDSDLSSNMSSLATPDTPRKPRKKPVKGEVDEGTIYHALAIAHAAMLDHERAIRCFITALRNYRMNYGMDSIPVAGALYDCGLSYSSLGDFCKAEDFWNDCLRILLLESKKMMEKARDSSLEVLQRLDTSQIDDTEHKSSDIVGESAVGAVDYARIVNSLGNVHMNNGQLDIALQCYEEALAIRRKLCNFETLEISQSTTAENDSLLRDIADTLHNTGWVYEMKGMYEKALACLNEALIIKRSISNEKESPNSNLSSGNDSALAIRHYDEMNIGRTLSCAITLLRIGSVHVKIYNHEVGLSYYKAALRIQRSELGHDHVAVARTLFDMGQIAHQYTDASGLNKIAMKCFNEALRIAKLQFGQDHVAVAGVMYDIGSIHEKSGNHFEAIAYYKSSVRVYGRIYGRSLLRRFVFCPIFKSVNNVSGSHHEGFNPTGLSDISDDSRARSSAEQAAAIADDRDRELYLRASIALSTVAEKSGVLGNFSCLGVELMILRMIEAMTANGVASSVGHRLRSMVQNIVDYIEKMASYASTSMHETVSNQYMYIVQG